MHRHIKNVSKQKVNIKKRQISLSVADRATHLLAFYIAMIVEDIQIEVIANKIEWITLTHTKKNKIFFFFRNILKELVASTNVKNVQTMVTVVEALKTLD